MRQAIVLQFCKHNYLQYFFPEMVVQLISYKIEMLFSTHVHIQTTDYHFITIFSLPVSNEIFRKEKKASIQRGITDLSLRPGSSNG
jgi:uncharacterized protein YbcV (DUF1398 family)